MLRQFQAAIYKQPTKTHLMIMVMMMTMPLVLGVWPLMFKHASIAVSDLLCLMHFQSVPCITNHYDWIAFRVHHQCIAMEYNGVHCTMMCITNYNNYYWIALLAFSTAYCLPDAH